MDFLDKFLAIVMIVVNNVMNIVDAFKAIINAAKGGEETTDAV